MSDGHKDGEPQAQAAQVPDIQPLRQGHPHPQEGTKKRKDMIVFWRTDSGMYSMADCPPPQGSVPLGGPAQR